MPVMLNRCLASARSIQLNQGVNPPKCPWCLQDKGEAWNKRQNQGICDKHRQEMVDALERLVAAMRETGGHSEAEQQKVAAKIGFVRNLPRAEP